MHHGALMLDIAGNANRPTELKGNYWNERRTVGEMRAKPIKPRKQKARLKQSSASVQS